jgi:hypothetical protein
MAVLENPLCSTICGYVLFDMQAETCCTGISPPPVLNSSTTSRLSSCDHIFHCLPFSFFTQVFHSLRPDCLFLPLRAGVVTRWYIYPFINTSAAMASLSSRAMSLTFLIILFNLTLFFSEVAALGKTDTITWGGDVSRAGYQNNHNLDPAVVGSAQFGLLYKTKLPGAYNGAAEQIFSQPLVYTLSDGIQYVFVATTQNNLYKINAKTGAIVLQRNLHIPFLTADLNGCVDINPLIGVTATGVIDPATDVWYLTAKTYVDQSATGAKGKPNGRYYVHAIDTNTLAEKPNFPVDLEGMVARNNPVRSFNGGIHHQRPALLQAGQYIYAGFASHCVQYNFTGWIVGWDKTSGALVERFATQGGESGHAGTVNCADFL